MPNVISVGVESPDALLNSGMYAAGALIRVQSSATEAGVYADLTGTGSTPTIPLVTLVTAYTGYDPNGTSSTYYRTRYENAGGTRLSDWSPVFLVGQGGYCSRDDVKQDLEKPITDTSADELLDDYIIEMTDYVRGLTGREFFPISGATWTFDGSDAVDGGRALLIPRGVRTISLFEASAYTGASFTTIASSDFDLLPRVQDRAPGWPATKVRFRDIIVGTYTTFPGGIGNVRLTGDFGFASVPARIEGVCRRTVVRAYAARQAGQGDLIGSGGEGGTPIVSQYLSRRDREILDGFRMVSLVH